MNKIIDIQNLNPDTFQIQKYSSEDEALISNQNIEVKFDPQDNYIEYFILDLNKNLLYENKNFLDYKIYGDNLTIEPQRDLEKQEYNEGQYYTVYNFLKTKLNSSPEKTLFIQDISTDRTELRLNTTNISPQDIIKLTNDFNNQITNSSGSYVDFYLNFGSNKLVIANNILLDEVTQKEPTVLIKLYEPLPNDINLRTQCWIVEKVSESYVYKIDINIVFDLKNQNIYIKGPNFNLETQEQTNNTTKYINKDNLIQSDYLLGSGSLYYQINNILEEKGIKINIDYSDYSQFIHFSSALTRLENFYYKLSLIEEYTYSSSLSNSTNINSFVSSSQILWDNKIQNIINNFDNYEYYLYYTSGSHAWPKTNSTFPYNNYLTNDPVSLAWFNEQSLSASLYDSNNKDELINTIPLYLKEDPNNSNYILFIQMIGQQFDNIWVYIKDITNKFDADNRLDYGISKDIIAQTLRDLGIKIYQNNFSSTNLYSSLLGTTPSGSNINIPYTTGSLPTPTGFEYIDLYITASDPNILQPLDDVNKEIYKRLYHNLPYLLKKKGTEEGLRTLINIYGIPDTILGINEFGGELKTPTNNYDNFYNQFNYEFYTTSSGYVHVGILINTGSGGTYGTASYSTGYYHGDSFNSDTSSFSIEFRFKTTGIPTDTSSYNQIIAYSPENNLLITLDYTGSGYLSGSYSGSIPDPYNKYGYLNIIDLASPTISSSLYLPFFNGDWWSVMYNLSDFNSNWILMTGYWADHGEWEDTALWID